MGSLLASEAAGWESEEEIVIEEGEGVEECKHGWRHAAAGTAEP
jgi:hypothetical protein